MNAWLELVSDHTFRTVVTGTGILGITSGILGSFAVLRKQSLLGDAMAHAALPGIAIAFLLTHSKSPLVLVIGAIAAGWIGTILMSLISRYTSLGRDAALGIVLSVFFGFGLLLLTYIQRLPTSQKTGLNTYLFGNAATLLTSDLVMMGSIGALLLLVLLAFWKEFKILSFDSDFSQVIGLPVSKLDIFLTTIIVISIVIGLQTVGVVLMSALIIAPASAARQWTDRLWLMVLISGLIGSASGMLGGVLSSVISHTPTGPMIVLVVSCFVLISLFFAPNRGLAWGMIRRYRNRTQIQSDKLLAHMLLFSDIETEPFHFHDISALSAVGIGSVDQTLNQLLNRGMVQHQDRQFWALTSKGLSRAMEIHQHLGIIHS